MRCPRCSTEAREPAARCPSCGASLLPESLASGFQTLGREPAAPVSTVETPRPPSSRSSPKARFLPGQLVSGRYRIIAVLGTGGMGEVYRADDLVLEQQVALKFLRIEIGADPTARERFVSEVKLARAVSHPNVCRVHDLGEVDGLLYLSMEYVDGEDLAALLRRIGAPSEKKAVEIASQLCAGLAAAHARGVLHRDLKPANVMIDGAGMVRITDFGLAIVAGEERERGLVEGTPAYMAPEQLTGGEATAKSDVYALGLVLYELFTGVRVWKPNDLGHLRQLHASTTPDPPSTHTRALDERIECTILSCLERDPARRPRSPTSVAAALTGADPIAAALAAGETPTPEMVAASGGEGTISIGAAGAALAAILLLFAALVLVTPRASQYGQVSMDEPAILVHRAREIFQRLDPAKPDGDSAFGFWSWGGGQDRNQGQLETNFWYREAPFYLQPFTRAVWLDDPPDHWSGMVSLLLSSRGKLKWLEAVPPQSDEPARPDAHCDWTPLFTDAGLVLADFKPFEGQFDFASPQQWDERAAWRGPDPGKPGGELTVAGASLHGRPVFFALDPWPRLDDHVAYLPGSDASDFVFLGVMLPALIGGSVLARRNLTSGRGDRRTAWRLSLVVALGQFISQTLLRGNHTTGFLLEWRLVERGVSWALFQGGFVWVIYMGLEPYVRRIWPNRLVSWSRLFAGRWRDPLVARDVMAGLGAGLLGALLGIAQVWIGMRLAAPQAEFITTNFPDAHGLRETIGMFCDEASGGFAASGMILFFLVVLRFFVRRNWIAYVLVALLALLPSPLTHSTGLPALDWAAKLFVAALLFFLVARCGLLALAVFSATYFVLGEIPLTSDMSAWYAGSTIFAALLVCGSALAAARLAIGRRALLS